MPKEKLTILTAAWNSYRSGTLPADAGEQQAKEARQAFYTGLGVMFEILMRGPAPDASLVREILHDLAEWGSEYEGENLERFAARRAPGEPVKH